MGRGSKFKGPSQVGAPTSSTAPAVNGSAKAHERKKHAGISDALRQAVLDLGGGEDDLDLIDGIDEDDESPPAPKEDKTKSSDVSAFAKT
jgi:ribosome biogenesis protein MAK21